MDEWPSPSSRGTVGGEVINIPQHTALEERIAVASKMKEDMEIGCRVVVDGMEDHFNKELAAWPIRYYIIKDQKILHQTGNGLGPYFDEMSLQNFFKGFGFVKESKLNGFIGDFEKDFEELLAISVKMIHPSSVGRQLCECCIALCCCPCLFTGFLCMHGKRKLNDRITQSRNEN